jgi:hypothetical protein
MKTILAEVSENQTEKLIPKTKPATKVRRDSRPHRLSIYKCFDLDWTEIDDCMLESDVAQVCEMQAVKPHRVDKRLMIKGPFVNQREAYFWQRVSDCSVSVPNKSAAECFQRYAAIQASAVAKFTA